MNERSNLTCDFVRKEIQAVRDHIGRHSETTGLSPKERDRFLLVIEADAADAARSRFHASHTSRGAASLSAAHRDGAAAAASQLNGHRPDGDADFAAAAVRRQPQAASLTNVARRDQAAAAAAIALPSRSSTVGGTQPAQVQSGAVASRVGSASDSGMHDEEAANANPSDPPPSRTLQQSLQVHGTKRKHDDGSSAAAAGAPAAADSRASRPIGAINTPPTNERSASSSVAGSAAAANGAAAGVGANVLSVAPPLRFPSELAREVKRRPLALAEAEENLAVYKADLDEKIRQEEETVRAKIKELKRQRRELEE
jgi:hypothetical protein